MRRPALVPSLALLLLPVLALAGAEPAAGGEPTNGKEAAQQNRAGKVPPEKLQAYHALVAGLPPAQQEWERKLEAQLGGFYFPIYLKNRMQPTWTNASDWGYVEDDPKLPRMLILGDSISRSYTADVRKLLAGKANVHRAPANCGPSDRYLKDLDTWLDQGSSRWDIITINVGIHDRAKPPEEFRANLERILARLEQTGATIVWVRTTPFGEGDDSGPINAVTDAVAAEHHLPVADLHAAIEPRRKELQRASDHTHFEGEGPQVLAAALVQAVTPLLAK